MNLSPMRSISVAVLLTVTLVLALPSLVGRSGMKAATCMTNPGVVNNSDSGAGSLRQAIVDACDGSTIMFANTVASPITLASELAIDKNLTIQGPGANALTISGNHAVRVFNIGSVNPAINVTLSGLTIANGNAPVTTITPGLLPGSFGGGIFNSSQGTLTIANSIISGNTAGAAGADPGSGSGGGGVANIGSGTVNVINSTISGNTATLHSFRGGGIANLANGVVNVTNSNFSGNNALEGGGLFNGRSATGIAGTVTVSNSTFSGNIGGTPKAFGNGGGIANGDGGRVTITGSTFTGNSVIDGDGGAIFSSCEGPATGPLIVNGSTFSGNTATHVRFLAAGAAAIGNFGTILTVSNSIFTGNSSDEAIVWNVAGEATFTGSTFSANTVQFGGILHNQAFNAALTVSNCTFSGNTGPQFGVYSISNQSGTANIANSTISGNEGGVFGTPAQFGTTNVKNTIIAGNSFPDAAGGLTSQGHNLIGKDDSSNGFTNGVNGDQVGSRASPLDPKLGPLQNNGGPTPTMALLPGSPAIDAGDDSVLGAPLFLTTDQRGPGFPRRFGAHVDIGAFELAFDNCLKDNSSGNLFQFSSTNGQYKFTRCSDGFMLSGTGVVRLMNGILTLTDSKPDRRVSAGFITGQRTGSATIYIMIGQGVWQTFRINSTNPAAVCSC
jgi:hypothetical protein